MVLRALEAPWSANPGGVASVDMRREARGAAGAASAGKEGAGRHRKEGITIERLHPLRNEFPEATGLGPEQEGQTERSGARSSVTLSIYDASQGAGPAQRLVTVLGTHLHHVALQLTLDAKAARHPAAAGLLWPLAWLHSWALSLPAREARIAAQVLNPGKGYTWAWEQEWAPEL